MYKKCGIVVTEYNEVPQFGLTHFVDPEVSINNM